MLSVASAWIIHEEALNIQSEVGIESVTQAASK